VSQVSASAHHPESIGKTERFHGTIGNMVAKLVDSTHKRWALPYMFGVHAYRTTANRTYGDTPYFLVHGRDHTDFADTTLLPPPSVAGLSPADQLYVTQWRAQLVQNVRFARGKAREIMEREQMIQTAKGHDKLPTFFDVGEKVWVLDETYATGEGLARKWQPRYLTVPYRVVSVREVEGSNAGDEHGGVSYELQAVNEPEDSQRTIVRNINHLKRHYEVEAPSDESPEVARVPRKRKKGVVMFPQPMDTGDLPTTGTDHAYNQVDEDEFEVGEIVGHRVERDPGRVSFVRYEVRPANADPLDANLWVKEQDLRAPRLLASYKALHPELADPNYEQPRAIRTRRMAAGLNCIVVDLDSGEVIY
jgi:hypothetical protein